MLDVHNKPNLGPANESVQKKLRQPVTSNRPRRMSPDERARETTRAESKKHDEEKCALGKSAVKPAAKMATANDRSVGYNADQSHECQLHYKPIT